MSDKDSEVVRIVSTLGVKYDPSGVKRMEQDVDRLSKLVKDASRSINDAMKRPVDANAAKTLVDQFGRPLRSVNEQIIGAAGAMRQMHQHAAKSIKETLPAIQAQTAQVQARLKAEKLGSSEMMNQARAIRDQVAMLQDRFNVSGKLSKDDERRVKALREEAAILKSNAQAAIADRKKPFTFADEVNSQFNRRLSWFASGAAIVGTYNEMRQGIQTVSDMESAMSRLNRVMTDSAYISGDMRKELSELGGEFGFTFDVVSEIATRWAQAGYSMADTLTATRATLIGLNTAEMDVKSGTESLIGIMSQWGMEAKDLTGIIDRLNLAADRYPITTGDLVDGLLRSGAAARNAGIDFEHTIGLLTAMREASGRAGKDVGTALNSILSFAVRKESLQTFEAAGISVYADVAAGKLRPLIDVLNDIASNWNKLGDDAKDAMATQAEAAGLFSEEMAAAIGKQEQWSDLQKRDVSSAAAAAYRRNFLLALLGNFARVQETVNALQEAEGYSLKENAKAMEAYGKKVQQLQAELQGALYALAEESGLLGGLKGMVDGLRSGVEWWNGLDAATRQALTTMALINATMLTLSATTKSFAGVSLAGAVTQLLTYVRTVGLAAAASKALDITLKSIFGPVGLIVMGITAIGGAWAYFSAQAKAAQDAAKNAGAQAEELERLRTRYIELEDNTKRTKTEEDELRTVSERLVKILPQLATKFDEFGKAMLNTGDVASQTKDRIRELKEETRALLEEEAKVGQTRLPDLESKLASYEDRYSRIREAVMKGPGALGGDLYIGVQPWDSASTKMAKAEKALSDLRERMKEVTEQINVYRAAIAAVEPPHVPSDNEIALEEKLAMRKWKPTPTNNSTTTGSSVTASGAKALVDAITSKTAALERQGSATERYIGILSTRLDIERQGGATAEHLAAADKERSLLIEALTKRQGELNAQAIASREAIVRLQQAQGALNLATDEGKTAYEEFEREIERLTDQAGTFANPIGKLSEEWWKLQKQKAELSKQDNAVTAETLRTLKDMREQYEKGITPIDQYVSALSRLESQAGLTADAMKQIDVEQASVWLKKWTKELEDGITKGDAALKTFGDDLDAIFKDFDTAGKTNDASALKNTLLGSLQSLSGTYRLPTNTVEAATATTKNLLNDIFKGNFAPDADALMKMDRTAFVSAITQGKNDLVEASNSVNELLVSLGNERDAVIRDIEGQIKPIQAVLNEFGKLEKSDAAKTLKANMNLSLGKLYGQDMKLPDLPSIKQVKDLVGGITVQDFGALAPDKFASAMKDNLSSLRGTMKTAQGYLDAVTSNYDAKVKAIDAEIRDIDASLKVRLGELQAELDALDAEDKQDQRGDEREQYLSQRKAITDEIAWRMENEDKYNFELAAKRKELADLEREWAEKQSDWAREDRREEVQDTMDAERAKADERKAALEEQRRDLEEQRQMWQEALNGVIEYVNGEIAGLQDVAQERVANLTALKEQKGEQYSTLLEALGNIQTYIESELGEWQRLADTRRAMEDKLWNDEKTGIRAIMNEGALNVLSDMASKGLTTGQSYIDSIISGINSRRGALEEAMNALTNTTTQYQQTQGTTGGAPLQVSGVSVKAMADGAYVKARPGIGVRAIVGEGKYDEWVQPVNKIQPMIDRAVFSSLRSFGGPGAMMTGADYAGMLRETVRAVANAFPDKLEASFTLPSGEVQRVVLKVFEGSNLMQAVRAM